MYSVLLTIADVSVGEIFITFWSLKCFVCCIDYCMLDWGSLLKVIDRKLTQVKNTLIRDALEQLFWKFRKQANKPTRSLLNSLSSKMIEITLIEWKSAFSKCHRKNQSCWASCISLWCNVLPRKDHYASYLLRRLQQAIRPEKLCSFEQQLIKTFFWVLHFCHSFCILPHSEAFQSCILPSCVSFTAECFVWRYPAQFGPSLCLTDLNCFMLFRLGVTSPDGLAFSSRALPSVPCLLPAVLRASQRWAQTLSCGGFMWDLYNLFSLLLVNLDFLRAGRDEEQAISHILSRADSRVCHPKIERRCLHMFFLEPSTVEDLVITSDYFFSA